MLEGKLTSEIRLIQEKHLGIPASNKAVTTWITGLIYSLIKIIHSQWIYRNEVVHKRTADGLTRVEGANIRIDIRSQLRLGRRGLDDEDKFLVEHTFQEINQCYGEEKKDMVMCHQGCSSCIFSSIGCTSHFFHLIFSFFQTFDIYISLNPSWHSPALRIFF